MNREDDAGTLWHPTADTVRPHARSVSRAAAMALINFLLRLPGHAFRLLILRRIAKVNVGAGTVIERGLVLNCRGGVTIGPYCIINHGVHLDGRGGLTIGAATDIGPGVHILTATHDIQSADFAYIEAGVHIGERNWIATESIVLPGLTTGNGVVVGARSVVTHDIGENSIVAGAPARIRSTRNEDAQMIRTRYRRFWH